MKSKLYPLLLFVVSFLFVALFSRSTSFLYVYEGFDAAIFKQMGLALLRGKTLYVDYFDNKGCILYFIQALGLWLGGNFGILLLQTVSLTVTLVIWDKMLALYRNEKERVVCLGTALVLLLGFYDGGDLSEEWCLPFASYPLLVYLQALKSKQSIRPIQWFAIGLCFGVIAFIRINNACAFLGFVAYSAFLCLREKGFRKLMIGVGCFVAGTALITLTCLVYFYQTAGVDGINEMVYATFLSNLEYIVTNNGTSLFTYLLYFLFVVLSLALLCVNSKKEISIPVILSYVLFVFTFGLRCFTHYLMVLLPLIVVLFTALDFRQNKKANWVLSVMVSIPLAVFLVRPVGFFVNDLILDDEKFKNSYEAFHRCVENIPESERDSIYNYNLAGIAAGMMQHEGLLQCNRVLYSPLVFNLPTLYLEETTKPIVKPKWILATGDKDFDEGDALFVSMNYDLIDLFEHNTVYIKNMNMGELTYVCLYRRKD